LRLLRNLRQKHLRRVTEIRHTFWEQVI
jgi:hypothetical protein